MCGPLIIQLTRKLPFGSTLGRLGGMGVGGGGRTTFNRVTQGYPHSALGLPHLPTAGRRCRDLGQNEHLCASCPGDIGEFIELVRPRGPSP